MKYLIVLSMIANAQDLRREGSIKNYLRNIAVVNPLFPLCQYK